ncbi:adenosine deaminase 2-like [Temnothorax nylanderi]|uniref:adenosine deaminase 2-like n=1 Tax=Temnothorax nylanderi TaxID=102681 RepID=UPI003A8877E7
MARAILFTLAILIYCQTILVQPLESFSLSLPRFLNRTPQQNKYWQLRQRMMSEEKQQSLGGKLELSPNETKANEILMRAKIRELYDGFITGHNFLPSRNFMEVIPEIEKSEVFKILRDMPKGAVLHAHGSAIASLDYRFNLTYRENLYVCDENSTLRLKFFDVPGNDCNWELLSKVREDPTRVDAINERIKRSMTMVTENPNSVYNTVDKAWEKFNSVFKAWNFLSYRPVFEDLHYRNLQELYEDNVMYAEIRSTLTSIYDLDGKTYGPFKMVQILKNVSDRFVKDHPDFIGAKIIYAPRRLANQERVENYLKTLTQLRHLYPTFIAGFDLVGQEDKGKSLSEFADKLNTVEPGTPFFFHAGETKWYGTSTDLNLFDAFLLNTKRIGHGYALTKHPLLWKLVQQLDIAVEVCPISNQVLGLVEDMRNHPAASLFASGSPVVVSNDDPAVWGAKGLSYDFYEAFMGIMSANSDLRSLKQLAINSLTYSSLSKRQQRSALGKWKVKWDAFVAKLANNDELE